MVTQIKHRNVPRQIECPPDWRTADETPAQVLTDLRKRSGLNRREFAEASGWSYWAQRRYEMRLSPLPCRRVQELLDAGWFQPESEWHVRIVRSFARQRRHLREGGDYLNVDPLRPSAGD